MDYQVVLAETAIADANQIYAWVVEQAPVRGAQWFEHLIDNLYSLERMPHRCPLAREAPGAKRAIHCLLFGKRRQAYRILFEIDEAGQTVSILHIRHRALKDLSPEDWTRPVARP